MSGMTIKSTNDAGDQLNQVIYLTQDLLNEILYNLQQMPTFDPTSDYSWNKLFTKITTDISQFVELTSLWAKLAKIKKMVDIESIRESHVHLLFILKAVNQAKIKSDTAVLDDLIKYELKDNLTQWKINIIPQMKKELQS